MSVKGISRQLRWLQLANKMFTRLQRWGVPLGPSILTVPGRQTGYPHRTPVVPCEHDGHFYLVAVLPGTDWAANAKVAGGGILSRGLSTRLFGLVELSAEEAAPVLRTYAAQVRVGVRIARRAGLVTKGSADEFAALAGQLDVFRLDPKCPGPVMQRAAATPRGRL